MSDVPKRSGLSKFQEALRSNLKGRKKVSIKSEPKLGAMDNSNTTWLITGCSQGLGLELVKCLLAHGSTTVASIIATSRSPEPNAALKEALSMFPARTHYVQLDITSDSSVHAAVEKSRHILGERGLDVLVNNAGLTAQTISNFAGDATPKMLMDCFEVNVIGVHRTINAFLPLCRASKQKRIINLSSTQGSCTRALIPPHVYSPGEDYKISKSALNMLSRQWAKSLGEEGFCVLLISPGWLQTNLGSFGGRLERTPDLPAHVGAEKTVGIIMATDKRDNGKFKNIKVEGFDGRYKGEDIEF